MITDFELYESYSDYYRGEIIFRELDNRMFVVEDPKYVSNKGVKCLRIGIHHFRNNIWKVEEEVEYIKMLSVRKLYKPQGVISEGERDYIFLTIPDFVMDEVKEKIGVDISGYINDYRMKKNLKKYKI